MRKQKGFVFPETCNATREGFFRYRVRGTGGFRYRECHFLCEMKRQPIKTIAEKELCNALRKLNNNKVMDKKDDVTDPGNYRVVTVTPVLLMFITADTMKFLIRLSSNFKEA